MFELLGALCVCFFLFSCCVVFVFFFFCVCVFVLICVVLCCFCVLFMHVFLERVFVLCARFLGAIVSDLLRVLLMMFFLWFA